MVRGSLLLVALLHTAHGKRRRKLGDHPTPDEKNDPDLLQRLREAGVFFIRCRVVA